MTQLVTQLAKYAAYHRDKKNIITHIVGIPMIVFAVLVMLSFPVWQINWLGNIVINPAMVLFVLAALYYFCLDLVFGFVLTLLLALGVWFAFKVASFSLLAWCLGGFGLFIVGWVIQFIGHYYEGKKPAFFDDLIGLAIGPLFVVYEIFHWLGLRKTLYLEVEKNVRA